MRWRLAARVQRRVCGYVREERAPFGSPGRPVIRRQARSCCTDAFVGTTREQTMATEGEREEGRGIIRKRGGAVKKDAMAFCYDFNC